MAHIATIYVLIAPLEGGSKQIIPDAYLYLYRRHICLIYIFKREGSVSVCCQTELDAYMHPFAPPDPNLPGWRDRIRSFLGSDMAKIKDGVDQFHSHFF